ncbi:hypothetical protein RI367_001686 [Sorochytrium milnesiophthora]
MQRQVSIGHQVSLRIAELNDTQHHGTTIWPAGMCLAHYFARTPEQLLFRNGRQHPRACRVLELGAGTGILALAIAQLASTLLQEGDCEAEANVAVMATDQDVPEIMDNLRRNVAMNAASLASRVQVLVQAYNWGTTPLPTVVDDAQDHEWDYVLAADCVYTLPPLPHLMWSIARLAKTPRTTVLVAMERRDPLVCDEFVRLARAEGFDTRLVRTKLDAAVTGADMEVWRLRRPGKGTL